MKVRELDKSHDRKCAPDRGRATEVDQDQDLEQDLDLQQDLDQEQDVQNVCERSGTVVRCAGGVKVEEGPQQIRNQRSPYLVAMVMNRLTRCMFADDMML